MTSSTLTEQVTHLARATVLGTRIAATWRSTDASLHGALSARFSASATRSSRSRTRRSSRSVVDAGGATDAKASNDDPEIDLDRGPGA